MQSSCYFSTFQRALNMLWLLAPIKNEIFRPTKSFTSLKKAGKKGHLD